MIYRNEPMQENCNISVGSIRFYPGYQCGFKQPSACIQLKPQEISSQQITILNQAIQYYLGQQAPNLTANMVQNMGQMIGAIQLEAGLPVFDAIQIKPLSNQLVELWVPTLFAPCVIEVCQFVVRLFQYYLQQTVFVSNKKFSQEFELLMAQLKKRAPQGSNSLKFLKAAHELNIPWVHFALNVFQYGHGKYARWLDSSFTDNMPQIGARLTNDKRTMTTLLFMHGFPVPDQFVVASETEALERAKQLQYPVVMKPIDGRNGVGVYTNLTNAIAVKNAFHAVTQYTKTVLLEKHIPGKDYRLVVFNGKLIWAIERVPAFVTGNNVDTIEMLIAKHNQKNRAFFPLLHIKINADLQQYLHENNLSLQSVPAENECIRLARIANIAAGATPMSVFDKVHPDNRHLVETAAKLLRLDLIGVDFISANIEESYLKNAGKIIEINVQPQLGAITSAHLYKQILSEMIVQQGRIPIIVLFGKGPSLILQTLTQNTDKQIGIAIQNKVIVNKTTLLHPPTLYHAGQTLLSMQNIDSIIYCIEVRVRCS